MLRSVWTEWRCRPIGQAPLAHIFGAANRRKSEKYGAVVHLCHERCHERGPEAVHNCRETDLMLKSKTQRELMERLGWSEDDFRREFGKSWL